MQRTSHGLHRDDSGSSLVEFAVIAPVLLAFLIGIVDLGYTGFTQVSLDAAVAQAARDAIATSKGCIDNEARVQTIKDSITESMKRFLQIEDPEITLKSYANFNSVHPPEPFTDINGNGKYDQGEPFDDIFIQNSEWDDDPGQIDDAGGPGGIVMYTAKFYLKRIVPPIRYIELSDPVLQASTIVRNEPIDCSDS